MNNNNNSNNQTNPISINHTNRQNIKVLQHYYIYKDKILGKGTFGCVYLGDDTKNNTPVAIKVIPLEKFRAQPERIIPSLKNEIKNMQMLNHKNIVQLYNVVKTENNLYIIVEYCNQGNLDKQIRQKTLSEEKCINIMCQIIEGFKCLNQNNIVHRDLKPENILLHDKTVKIADFGFSKVVEQGMEKTILESFVGTPLYMSPQILQKQNYTSKTDIWSLGMIFYELIYSRRAWEGKGYYNLLDNILKKPLQFPILPKAHQQTKEIIGKMLQLKEEDRIGWEELFLFFSYQNIRQIYSDFIGNGNHQQQQIQLHLLYDSNCNSRQGNHPSSPTSTFSMKSERIEDESGNGNIHSDTNLNRMDEENNSNIQNSNNSNNNSGQQKISTENSSEDEVMNESQMNNLLEYFTQNVNVTQQFQLILQLQNLLNKKRGQKLTINEVKQMVLSQIKPSSNQSSSQYQQVPMQQGMQMKGGLFANSNIMMQQQLQQANNSIPNQINLQQQESYEMKDTSSQDSQANKNNNNNNQMNGNNQQDQTAPKNYNIDDID